MHFRASVGHPPLIRVKRANPVNVSGQEIGLSLAIAGTGYQFPDGPTPTQSSSQLAAVSTFHNIGLYWGESSGSNSNEALVRFRKQGEVAWRRGHSLWWDNRNQGSDPPVAALTVPYGAKEYRGSLVKLDANSTYEVEVMTLVTRKISSIAVSTWNEVFPEGTITNLPALSNSQLTISVSGTPSAYRVYRPAPGDAAVIDGNNNIDYAIRISGSYIIVRGVTIRDIRRGCVVFDPTAHDIVIENCDCSKYGRPDPLEPNYGLNDIGGFGTTSGGQTANLGIVRVVVQNCRFHEPTYDSNSWAEPPRLNDGDTHPENAGVSFMENTGGNHVIRYNEVFADFDRMFDDCISGQSNFSFAGDFRRDSDFYGNKLSHCWDDCIQVEGAGMNCRIYENYTEYALVSISCATVSIGPMYVFRNVATRGSRAPNSTAKAGSFFKSYGKTLNGTNPNFSGGTPDLMTYGGGRVFLYHNTCYKSASATIGNGAIESVLNADQLGPTTITSRNNIWDTVDTISSSKIATINGAFSTASWNFDLVGAGHTSWQQIEANCIVANPIYDPVHASGPYTQATNSPALNAGEPIPNFNDDYIGTGPDIGAQERGATALRFGNR